MSHAVSKGLLFLLFFQLAGVANADVGIRIYLELDHAGIRYYTEMFSDFDVKEDSLCTVGRYGHCDLFLVDEVRKSFREGSEYRDWMGIKLYRNITIQELNPDLQDRLYLPDRLYFLTNEVQHYEAIDPDRLTIVRVLGVQSPTISYSANLAAGTDWINALSSDVRLLFRIEHEICGYNFYGVHFWYTPAEIDRMREQLLAILENDFERFPDGVARWGREDIFMVASCAC